MDPYSNPKFQEQAIDHARFVKSDLQSKRLDDNTLALAPEWWEKSLHEKTVITTNEVEIAEQKQQEHEKAKQKGKFSRQNAGQIN